MGNTPSQKGLKAYILNILGIYPKNKLKQKNIKGYIESILLLGVLGSIIGSIILLGHCAEEQQKKELSYENLHYREKWAHGDSVYRANISPRLTDTSSWQGPEPEIPKELEFESAVLGLLDLYY